MLKARFIRKFVNILVWCKPIDELDAKKNRSFGKARYFQYLLYSKSCI